MGVVSFPDKNAEPDADTVEVLEAALDMARAGQLRSVALAGNMTGHQTYTHYATADLMEAIGLVSFLHFTICSKQRESRYED